MNRASEPFVRITKRDAIPAWKAWGIRLGAIVLSLLVCAAVIYFMVRLNPLKVYEAMWNGAFGTARRTWVTVRDSMMLLCIAIGLAPLSKCVFGTSAPKARLLAGGIVTAACMLYLGSRFRHGCF